MGTQGNLGTMNLIRRFQLSRDRSVTVANLVDELLRRRGDCEISASEDGPFRLAELHAEVCSFDAFLRRSIGLRPGEPVAIYRTNDRRCFHWFLAVIRAGGIAVPLNPQLSLSEVRRILADSGAEILVTDKAVFERHRYKSAKTVIQTLADIVSKNGNLLLSIPVRADGTIDSDEVKIVEGIADWMDVNRQCIFDTRPWKVFGEGPAIESAAPISNQGFNEGKGKPFTAEDMRFTQKGDTLYAIALGWPTQPLKIKSLGKQSKLLDKRIESIQLLGTDEVVRWSQGDDALVIEPAANKLSDAAVVFKIKLE